jgi:glycerate 2-kinase
MAERAASGMEFRKDLSKYSLFPHVKGTVDTILENSVEELMKKGFQIRNEKGARKLYVNGKLKHDNLDSAGTVWVLGGGKAGIGMAQAVYNEFKKYGLESKLKGTISTTHKLVEEFRKEKGSSGIGGIEFKGAGHPTPDQGSIDNAKEIIETLREKVEKGDLVICPISGGGSALMTYPQGKVTLDDMKKVNKILVGSKWKIQDINAVRGKLDAIKKGGLAKNNVNKVPIVGVVLSDVIPTDLSVIASGPLQPDNITFKKVCTMLKKGELWSGMPESVRVRLTAGAEGKLGEEAKPLNEKSPLYKLVSNEVIGSNENFVGMVKDKLEKAGMKVESHLGVTGEAHQVGDRFFDFMTSLNGSKKIKDYLDKGGTYAAIFGGEQTVDISGDIPEGSRGGRTQVMLVKFMKRLLENIDFLKGNNVALVTMASDGKSGVSDFAGGFGIGDQLLDRIKDRMGRGKIGFEQARKGLIAELDKNLREYNSDAALRSLGMYIQSGETGHNVNDVFVGMVKKREKPLEIRDRL